MKKIKPFFLALCAFTLTGCIEPDTRGKITTENQPNNGIDYNVRLLFEADGVKVYKFYDQEACRAVYFTNTTGNTSYEYTTTHRAGWAIHHHVGSINTIDRITHDPDCPCLEKGGKDE